MVHTPLAEAAAVLSKASGASAVTLEATTQETAKQRRQLTHAVCANALGILVIVLYTIGRDIGLAWRSSISAEWELGVMGAIIMIVGVPHTVLDALLVSGGVARSWTSTPAKPWLVYMMDGYTWLMYLALIVMTFLSWFTAPWTSLLVFLTMVGWHFGEGDVALSRMEKKGVDAAGTPPRRAGQRSTLEIVEIIARGGTVILTPIVNYPGRVAIIFQIMLGSGADVVPIMQLLKTVRLIHLPIFAVSFLKRLCRAHRLDDAIVALEMAVVFALFALAPPLVAFSVYFIAFHSMRHFMRVASFTPQAMRENGRCIAIVFTALALMFMAAFAVCDMTASSAAFVPLALRVFFVSNHALTTPHMILVEFLAFAERAGVKACGRSAVDPAAKRK